MATFINFTYQIFVHEFFKNSQYTANGERWPCESSRFDTMNHRRETVSAGGLLSFTGT